MGKGAGSPATKKHATRTRLREIERSMMPKMLAKAVSEAKPFPRNHTGTPPP